MRPTVPPVRLADVPALVTADWVGDSSLVTVTGVTLNSREVHPGDCYAALPGQNTHGANYVAEAVAAGAVAILTDPTGASRLGEVAVPIAVLPDPRAELGNVAAYVYGNPADRLEIIGVTGTNGKTTLSYLLEAGLQANGVSTGIIGTTGVHIGAERLPSARTTPEATDVHRILALMVERGVNTVAMEVSSHALALGRVAGVTFDAAVFTNLSQDHLDFHGSMAAYFAVKASLFRPGVSQQAVVCVDDQWGRQLLDLTPLPTTTYGVAASADWRISGVRQSGTGSWSGLVTGPTGHDRSANIELLLTGQIPGHFNQVNALGALATLAALGYDPNLVATGIQRCTGVPGRMQRVPTEEFAAFVDYAHTPDAVSNVLAATRAFTHGAIITVLGCGGDRDQEKRALMGATAAAGSDQLIITDDNPRSEPAADIRAEMRAGVAAEDQDKVVEIGDRRAAIQAAVRRAQPGDCILLLGKGHEQGQEIAGEMLPFNDVAELSGELGRVESAKA